jgi:hypothetical protein
MLRNIVPAALLGPQRIVFEASRKSRWLLAGVADWALPAMPSRQSDWQEIPPTCGVYSMGAG